MQVAFRLQEERRQRGCGGLAVASGHADHPCGGQLHKQLHLRRKNRTALHGIPERRQVGAQSGRAEDHRLVKRLQVVLAQPEGNTRLLQPVGSVPQLRAGLAVTGNNLCTVTEKKIDQRQIGNAKPHNRIGSGQAFLHTSGQFQCSVPFFRLAHRRHFAFASILYYIPFRLPLQ